MKKSKFLIVPMIAFGMVSLAKAEPLVEESAIPGEFSANISLTSDYIFRGISQTGNNPAVQGGFDYTYDFGPAAVSAGIWASNVKFSDATIEIDYYAGVGGSIDNFSWDLSAIYYTYPGADSSLNYDFFEIAPSIGYDFGFMAVSAGLNYSPEYFGDSGDAYYTHGGIDIPLGKYFTLSGTVGYQAIDDNAAWGTDDYTDYGISLSTEIAGFGLSAGWTDTDLSKSQCDDACGVFSVALSRSF
ncbi:hypothetical protein J0X12_08155 [Sneathiella sp. CAU 1612]|uniref:TIGR02001 family outer membrane protein n=1 Tax=Sneathiella sedimenti TaxID=2816034 RepID=A0ABS3F619_9PROT|nr:TorF family putative porin [Sneathiella sedimenti]MBO0333581.1 hypothetical protein [Sneathiella sedimenti]